MISSCVTDRAPCRKEVPELQNLLQENANARLELFGFATRTNNSSVNAFLQNHGITYPQVADFDSVPFT